MIFLIAHLIWQQRKHQSSELPARGEGMGIRQLQQDSPFKWPVMRKVILCHDNNMTREKGLGASQYKDVIFPV